MTRTCTTCPAPIRHHNKTGLCAPCLVALRKAQAKQCGCGKMLDSLNTTGSCRACNMAKRASEPRPETVYRLSDAARTQRINNGRAMMRPAPDDLAEHMNRSYDDMTSHWNASADTIRRWITESGLERKGPVRAGRPVPAGYKARRDGYTAPEMAKHFGTSKDTVRRWDSEVGFKAPARTKQLPMFREAQPTQRDMTIAGMAADYMRSDRPVYRCNERGGPDPKGRRWRCGSAVLSDAELIERASYRGFEPQGVRI